LSYWYGLSFAEIADMPFTAISAYLERLPARQAETKMMMADVVSYPHMKALDRQSALRGWMKQANARQPEQRRPASPAALKLLGIGVTYMEPQNYEQ
jgi:hypothetical protein